MSAGPAAWPLCCVLACEGLLCTSHPHPVPAHWLPCPRRHCSLPCVWGWACGITVPLTVVLWDQRPRGPWATSLFSQLFPLTFFCAGVGTGIGPALKVKSNILDNLFHFPDIQTCLIMFVIISVISCLLCELQQEFFSLKSFVLYLAVL